MGLHMVEKEHLHHTGIQRGSITPEGSMIVNKAHQYRTICAPHINHTKMKSIILWEPLTVTDNLPQPVKIVRISKFRFYWLTLISSRLAVQFTTLLPSLCFSGPKRMTLSGLNARQRIAT